MRAIDDSSREPNPGRAAAPAATPPPAAAPPMVGMTPMAPDPAANGSEPPPADAGGEGPDTSYPVPPVPPPPTPGPVFSLAGSGAGGATSFARPGTDAAKPFRSPIFTANRSTAPQVRFGAGAPVSAGGGTPFMPAGLEGGGDAGAAAPDDLARIMALLRGGGAGA